MGESLRNAARRLRELSLGGLRATGGLRGLAGSSWRQRRLLILCYHGVSLRDEHEWNNLLFVTPAFLRRRLEILRDGGYSVLPLADAVRALRAETLPARSVVLTFDDGFHDFLAAAVPVLEEFGVPATNYMSTYYCVNQHPLPLVTLRYLMWRARPRVLAAGTLPGQESEANLRDPKTRERLASALLDAPAVRAGGPQAQQALLAEVAEKLGIDWDEILRARLFHLLAPAEVAEVARRGFDIQLHTHRHRTPRDEAAFRDEITRNRQLIEEMTGRSATHFCYPSGDVDARFLPWLRDLGVETATTTAVSALAGREDEPLLLPRFVDTMSKTDVVFESWLSGAGALLSRSA